MSYRSSLRSIVSLPAVAFAFLIAGPAAAVPVFNIIGVPCDPTDFRGSSPVSAQGTCQGLYGVASGSGFANYGSVGAEVSAFHQSENSTVTGGGIRANFSDQVVFSSTDNTIRSFPVALLLTYAGSIAGGFGDSSAPFPGNWSGSIDASATFGSAQWVLVQTRGSDPSLNRVFNSGFEFLSGAVASSESDALLRTSFREGFALDTPYTLALSIAASAGATGPGLPSARTNAANTFEIPFDMDVFILPPGVTANAGTWLVNNRRVRQDATAVPEPGTLALMSLGLCAVLAARRSRAGRSV